MDLQHFLSGLMNLIRINNDNIHVQIFGNKKAIVKIENEFE